MSAELSVIIPTYKRTSSLKDLLTNLLQQENIELEIIVVDQNPENYFDEDLRNLLKQTRWLRQEKPNASEARNRGFLSSAGPYVLFIDDDLVPTKDFCRRGVDVFTAFNLIEGFSPLVYNDEGGSAAILDAKRKLIKRYPDNADIFSVTDTISAAIFFKRGFFLKTGGFDNLLFEFARTAEDQEFFLRMLRKDMTVWFVPFVQVYHDEKVPGGCGLRSDDYWITREKCMKAWALRYRTYKSGKISVSDFVKLFRSGVFNREVLSSSPKYIFRQLSLMIKAIRQSGSFFRERENEYRVRTGLGFLKPGPSQIEPSAY